MFAASVPASPSGIVVSQEIVESSGGSKPSFPSIISWSYSETAPSSPIEGTFRWRGADAWTTMSAVGTADGTTGVTGAVRLIVGVGVFDGAVPGPSELRKIPPSDSAQRSAAPPPSRAFLVMGTHPAGGECRRQQPGEQEHAGAQDAGETGLLCDVSEAVGLGVVQCVLRRWRCCRGCWYRRRL